MKTVFHENQTLHEPQHFRSDRANPEHPDRVRKLLEGVSRLGLEVIQPRDHGLAPLAAVHTPEYLAFLENIYERWSALEPVPHEEVLPGIHPVGQLASYSASPIAQAGYHMADTACPISANTWKSAYWSAQTAACAASRVLDGESSIYALCRPPGHHAFAAVAGGVCYVNNAAVAAETCVRAGLRPAVVDIDVHHGNGTQGIFYHRSDVLTVSVHADPDDCYPFFWGHAHERGEGPGLGANLNLPLPMKSGEEAFLEALRLGMDRVRIFGADILILSLGLDTFEGDPAGVFTIPTSGYARIAELIAKVGLPTVIVQEGGYLCPELGDNLAGFLGAFLNIHNG